MFLLFTFSGHKVPSFPKEQLGKQDWAMRSRGRESNEGQGRHGERSCRLVEELVEEGIQLEKLTG